MTETRPSGTTDYTYNAGDELTQTSGPDGTTGFSYDGNGNQTTDGSTTYTYNLANQLTAASSGGASTAYTYDGDGNRLSETTGGSTTRFVWDTNGSIAQLALERDGSGDPLRTYIQGLDTLALVEGGSLYSYSHDRLGSITALTDPAGNTEWTYTYEPFGTPRTTVQVDPNAPVNPLGYTGQYTDPSTSLLDLRARQYNPALGAFTSTDPTPNGTTSPYESAYTYAGQDPINGYDLDGLCNKKAWYGLTCPAANTAKKAAKATVSGVTTAAKTVAKGLEDYGNGSLTESLCVYYCVGAVGYHGKVYLQTGEKGVFGPGALWSNSGPYPKSDNISACVAVCIGRSVEPGTGSTSYSFGIGTVGVQGGHARNTPLFTLPWYRR